MTYVPNRARAFRVSVRCPLTPCLPLDRAIMARLYFPPRFGCVQFSLCPGIRPRVGHPCAVWGAPLFPGALYPLPRPGSSPGGLPARKNPQGGRLVYSTICGYCRPIMRHRAMTMLHLIHGKCCFFFGTIAGGSRFGYNPRVFLAV